MITFIAFILILSVVILVHEWGHFRVARACGVTVEEFGFGFPPKIVTLFRRGGTSFTLNGIPFGGFVRLKGEGGIGMDDRDAFQHQSVLRRFMILASGVGMNYLLAAVLLSVGLMIGVTMNPSDVAPGALSVRSQLQVIDVAESSPAADAGILPGDAIVRIDGQSPSTVEALQEYQKNHAGSQMHIEILRGNAQRNLTVTPRVLEAQDGQPRLGVHLTEAAFVSYPPHRALLLGTQTTVILTGRIFASLGTIVKELVVSRQVTTDVVGPVGVAVLTGQVAKLGLAALLQFTALLSLSLAVMNFLPIPALDGGRALFVLIERLRGKAMNARVEMLIHNVGFYLLIALVIAISVRDLGKFGIITSLRDYFTR